MSGLLGPNGKPISQYKKERPKALGPSFGAWHERDRAWNQLPGGAILEFDLSQLTLADFRSMRYNPQINSSLSVLTFMLHQIDWHIKCEDKKVQALCEDQMRIVWTRLIRGMSQSFWAGFSPMVVEYENNIQERTVEVTKFKDLVPEDCSVKWKKVKGTYVDPNTPQSLPPEFWVYDGIKQWGVPNIPPENTLWYPLLMENGDMYGRKLLKAAFAPWYFSTLMHLFSNRYYERFGEPLPVGRAPFDEELTDPEDTTKTINGKTAMERMIMQLRNRNAVVLPSERQQVGINSSASEYTWDIEYLESQMRGVDFERYMSRLDEEMSLALFTPLLLLRNADVGSHNLGVQHTQTWLWMLNALAGDMKEYIDRYVLQRMKAYNFSPNAPRVEWIPRPMGKENAETLRAIVSILMGGKGAQAAKVDIDELGMALGMNLTEVRTVTRDNPDEPDGGPGSDDRVDRDRNVSDGPRGVGEPRATGREVAARIRTQVEKAWREKRFGSDLKLDFGYRSRFVQSLVAEGCARDRAEALTNQFYSRLDTWTTDALSLEFSSPNDFMALFERNIDNEIDDLKS